MSATWNLMDLLGSNRLGSPCNINVLLHFYSSYAPLPNRDAPAVMQAVDWLLSVGAIEVATSSDPGSGYVCTPLGKAWVEALCKVRMPQRAFVDEHGTLLSTQP